MKRYVLISVFSLLSLSGMELTVPELDKERCYFSPNIFTEEALIHIIRPVLYQDKISLQQTCKQLHQIISKNNLTKCYFSPDVIPQERLTHIIAQLPNKDKITLHQTSKTLHNIVSKNNLILYNAPELNFNQNDLNYGLALAHYGDKTFTQENLIKHGAIKDPTANQFLKTIAHYNIQDKTYQREHKHIIAAFFGDTNSIKTSIKTQNNRLTFIEENCAIFEAVDSLEIAKAAQLINWQATMEGHIALSAAIENNQTAALLFLLKQEEVVKHINKPDKNNVLPFFLAINKKYTLGIEELLKLPTLDVNIINEKSNMPIHMPLINNDPALMKLLLSHCNNENKYDCDVNATDKKGNTALHTACMNNNSEIIQLLLEHHNLQRNSEDKDKTHLHDIDVNSTNNERDIALHLACLLNSLEAVHLLLTDPTIGINIIDSIGDTPLIITCKYKNVEIVKLLLAHRDNNNNHILEINRTNNRGKSPLLIACEKNDMQIAELLLTDPTIDINRADQNGDTPIHIACRNSNTELIKLLVTHKDSNNQNDLEINRANNKGEVPLHIAYDTNKIETIPLLLINPTIDINMPNQNGETLLYIAYCNNNTELVKALIDHQDSNQQYDLDVNATNRDGDTPIHIACRNNNTKTVELLLAHRDNRGKHNIDIRKTNKDGNTALHVACSKNNTYLMLLLLLSSPNINLNQVNNNNETISDIAFNNNALETMAVLLSYVDPNKADKNGKTFLEKANDEKNIEKIKILLSLPKIDLNRINRTGNTFLHQNIYALIGKKNDDELKITQEILQLLLSHTSLQPNIADSNGHTPLHIACNYGLRQVVESLLKLPTINPNTVDKQNHTVLYDACNNNKKEIVEILLRHPKIDPNKAAKKECNPLNGAFHYNEILKLLLAHPKIDPNRMPFYLGKTILDRACWQNNSEKVKMILAHPKTDPNIKDQNGYTPLHSACHQRNKAIIELLLGHKDININPLNNQNNAPLVLAYDNQQIRDLFLSRPDFYANIPIGKEFLLHKLYDENNFEEIKKLLSKYPNKINPNIKDKEGNTILHKACYKGNETIIKFLLKKVSFLKINEVNTKGDSALDILINMHTISHSYNDTDIVELFLKYPNIDINQTNKKGETYLYRVYRLPYKRIIELFLDHPKIDIAKTAEIANQNKDLYFFKARLEEYKNNKSPLRKYSLQALRLSFVATVLFSFLYAAQHYQTMVNMVLHGLQ